MALAQDKRLHQIVTDDRKLPALEIRVRSLANILFLRLLQRVREFELLARRTPRWNNRPVR